MALCGRPGFNPWVGKIPWRRKWQSTPVLLPGESHGQRSLVGYSPWGHKESDTTERTSLHFTSLLLWVLKKPLTSNQTKTPIKRKSTLKDITLLFNLGINRSRQERPQFVWWWLLISTCLSNSPNAESPFLYPHYVHTVSYNVQLGFLRVELNLLCSSYRISGWPQNLPQQLFRNRSTNGWLLWVSSRLIFLQTGMGPWYWSK